MKVRCPRCNRIVEWEGNEWRPFCSERCKLIDLGAWVSEEYRISGERVSYSDDISQPEEDGE
ncbi:DNA gyrase inhibitor YacG [bacterium HR37]|jgi:endogenous inhibitor of DNA gyrase (YacG/DUF329 family)|nr:DNA gyrase inhibitor YacG [bacterium HR37]